MPQARGGHTLSADVDRPRVGARFAHDRAGLGIFGLMMLTSIS
jgi:hypothetical protein